MKSVEVLLLIFLGWLAKLKGDYVIEVELHSYSNPSSHCAGVGCDCDSPHGCRCCDFTIPGSVCGDTRRCDNQFAYCLQRAESLSPSGGPVCSQGGRGVRTSMVNWNDASINFTAGIVLGLNNSFNVPGIERSWKGAILYAEVTDYDSMKDDDLVDVFAITIEDNIPVGQKSSQRLYHGIHGIAEIELSFTIGCTEDFYGPRCNISCPRGADCSNCNPGFTGAYCHIKINYCANVSCGNGDCVDQATSFLCMCHEGFVGDKCDLLNHCQNNPCVHGNCTNAAETFVCRCEVGFTSERCDQIDHCASNNCSDQMACVNTHDSFLCQCEPGDVSCDGSCPNGILCRHTTTSESRTVESAVIGGVGGTIGLLLLVIVIAILILVALNASKRKKQRNLSGKTVIMAGDNPIYVINSDIIPISVPHNKDSARKDYINIYPAPTREQDQKGTSFDYHFACNTTGSSLSGTNVHCHEYINVHPELGKESFSRDEGVMHVRASRRDYINVTSGECIHGDKTDKCWGFHVTAMPETSPSTEEFSTQANELKNSERKGYVNIFPGGTKNLSSSDEKEVSCGVQSASGTRSSASHDGMETVEVPVHSNGVNGQCCAVHPISAHGSTQTADSSRRHCYENV